MGYEYFKELMESKKKKANVANKKKNRSINENKSSKMNVKGKSDNIFKILDEVTQEAMKDSLIYTIMESSIPDKHKSSYLSRLNKNFSRKQALKFLNEIVSPITEMSTLLVDKKAPKKSISVHAPVYEIASVLECARNGILSEESVDAETVTEEPILDNSNDVEENIVTDYAEDTPMQPVEDLVDFPDPYNEPNEGLTEEGDLDSYVDVNQFEDNDPSNPDEKSDVETDEIVEEDVFTEGTFFGYIFKEMESEIDTYVGDEAGNPENGLPDKPMEYPIDEDLPTSAFEGDEAGANATGDHDPNEFKADTVNEELMEQIKLAKRIIRNIFEDYSITNKLRQKALIHEAISVLGKNGITSLKPSLYDISEMVVKQDLLASSKDPNSLDPKSIITMVNTIPGYVPSSVKDGKLAYLHKLENTRRDFRSKVSGFSPSVKRSLSENWLFYTNKTTTKDGAEKKFIGVNYYITNPRKSRVLVSEGRNDIYVTKLERQSPSNHNLVLISVLTELATRQVITKNTKKYTQESIAELRNFVKSRLNLVENKESKEIFKKVYSII